MDIVDDYGEQEIADHGMISNGTKQETYTIQWQDPLSATCELHWRHHLRRGTWRVHTETNARLTCDAEHYHLNAVVTACEGTQEVFHKEFSRSIPRPR